MNYQLANNPSLNLEKKDLIQKLIAKNISTATKSPCISCGANGGEGDPL